VAYTPLVAPFDKLINSANSRLTTLA